MFTHKDSERKKTATIKQLIFMFHMTSHCFKGIREIRVLVVIDGEDIFALCIDKTVAETNARVPDGEVIHVICTCADMLVYLVCIEV